MNRVEIDHATNKVTVTQNINQIVVETIRIESDYHYAHPGHVVDVPKEREK